MSSDTPLLAVSDLHVRLGESAVLDGTCLTLQRGETAALLGASGSGKTTLLRTIAGLVPPAAGRIDGTLRRPALIFQEPRLLPWRSAIENAAVGAMAGEPRAAIREEKARDMLIRCGLPEAAWLRKPAQLSGGMRARVALARALLHDPDLLLLDEPFVSLDIGARQALRDLVVHQAQAAGIALLHVTHDLLEAAAMASRILVMARSGGRIVADHSVPVPAASDCMRQADLISDTVATLLADATIRSALMGPVNRSGA